MIYQTTNRLPIKFASLVFVLILVACSDKKQKLSQLETCENHFQAESYHVAKQECEIASKEGSARAMWLVAHLYHHNLLNEGQNLEKAFDWYLQAANKGHIGAMRTVGQSYMYENGVKKDYKKAHNWLMKAAKKHDPEAEYGVGLLFFEGWGHNKDIASAINWFKRAAMKNHTMSINNLAWLFATSNSAAFHSAKKASFWIGKLDQKSLEIPIFIDTKAAVMAANGDFEQAIKLQNLAIAKLPTDTTEDDLLEFQKHLDNYIQGKRWNE